MFPLGVAWVVVSPYLVGLAVAHWRPLNRAVARCLPLTALLGWAAIAALVGVVFFGDGGAEALIAAPFVGLAFWIRRPGDDGDDGPPAPDEPIGPTPTYAKRFDQPRKRTRGPHRDGTDSGKRAARTLSR